MRMIEPEMKELECSQDFSHYNSMRIFPDAQGQLNLQSMVGSGPKMKALECSQHYTSIFQMRKGR